MRPATNSTALLVEPVTRRAPAPGTAPAPRHEGRATPITLI